MGRTSNKIADRRLNFCGVCCHCGIGIPYSKYYELCLYCDLKICENCIRTHPRSHRPGFRHGMDKMLPHDALFPGVQCQNCKQVVTTRMECSFCNIRVCMDCWEPEDLMDHEHRGFTFWRCPDDYVYPNYEPQCGACQSGSSLLHCNRCLAGIRVGEKVYECLGCIEMVNESRRVCEACLPVAKAEHARPHEWVSMEIQEVEVEDVNYCAVRCGECDEVMPLSKQTKLEHPHKNLIVEMGSSERESRAHWQYRRCPKHAVKNIDKKEDDHHIRELSCGCCHKVLAKNAKAYFCLHCDFLSCARCERRGITNHPHDMFGIRLRGSVPPDDVYKDIATEDNTRQCGICEGSILVRAETHLSCRGCNEFAVCQPCINGKEASVSHGCGEWPNMNLVDPQDMGEVWLQDQLDKAETYKAELKRERARKDEGKASGEIVEDEQNQQPVVDLTGRQAGEVVTRKRAAEPGPEPTMESEAPEDERARKRPASQGVERPYLEGATQATMAVEPAMSSVGRSTVNMAEIGPNLHCGDPAYSVIAQKHQ